MLTSLPPSAGVVRWSIKFATPWNSLTMNPCDDIPTGTLGILSTPVIDLAARGANGNLGVVYCVYKGIDVGNAANFWFVGVDLISGVIVVPKSPLAGTKATNKNFAASLLPTFSAKWQVPDPNLNSALRLHKQVPRSLPGLIST